MLHVSKTTCHVCVCLQQAPPWMRSWPPLNGAASTWGRPNCGSWLPTRTMTPTTSWLRSGRVSGWRRYGRDRSSSSVTPRAFLTLPTPWPAASTRPWGGLKRPRRSLSLRTKAFRALTGRASFVFRLHFLMEMQSGQMTWRYSGAIGTKTMIYFLYHKSNRRMFPPPRLLLIERTDLLLLLWRGYNL